jgi:hypothetical protein
MRTTATEAAAAAAAAKQVPRPRQRATYVIAQDVFLRCYYYKY